MSVRKPCQFERLQVLQEFLTKQEGRKGQDWAGCTQELKRQPSQKMPDQVAKGVIRKLLYVSRIFTVCRVLLLRASG